ncbi:hypothetical protein PsorP6_017745 [Peronosclerospora sorghi]|uniref:Uncharacterized protein n=1 Tax=Peronosclerospora sorghi TaxID=230839 RepID=A0ACC0WMB7_9STRA|nr:hypothetical protein PsorP6_017745 [Peronosclerospora sorghi]
MLEQHAGEFYLGFCVGVTILEKALYDVHRERAERDTPLAKSQMKMILRDLLHSDTLKTALPTGLIGLLKILFLPSGLNVRNLVWHGFLAPAEFPRCFGCLTLVLIMMMPTFSVERRENRLENMEQKLFCLETFDDKFVTRSELPLPGDVKPGHPHLVTFLQHERPESRHQVISRWVSSSFIPSGRRNLVQRAIHALVERGDELWFLFAVLPVLEHGLRREFLRVNQTRARLSGAYEVAQTNAYYSTLDGFGQKDKHQVLLHPTVFLDADNPNHASDATKVTSRNDIANGLYEELPLASLVILLDLFMMSSGPNLRAKLCHGEANLSSFMMSRNVSAPKISKSCHLLFEALVLICENKVKHVSVAESEVPLPTGVQNYLVSISRATTCSFHPFYRLHRALHVAHGVASTFAAFRETWTSFTLDTVDTKGEGTSSLTRVTFSRIQSSDGKPFTIVETSSRVADLQTRIANEATDATEVTKEQTKSLTYLIRKLHDRLTAIAAVLNDDLKRNHRSDARNVRGSAFLALVEEGNAQPTLDLRTRPMERNVLALSDHDGLSVASCMMEIILCCRRSLATFRARIEHLEQLVRQGKARTNHRRSLLTSIAFLAAFERMQLVSLTLVEHQLVHLYHVATQAHVATTFLACPRSVYIEHLQPKLLQCITSFEGCTGRASVSHKGGEQAVERALQFLNSKAVQRALYPLT